MKTLLISIGIVAILTETIRYIKVLLKDSNYRGLYAANVLATFFCLVITPFVVLLRIVIGLLVVIEGPSSNDILEGENK